MIKSKTSMKRNWNGFLVGSWQILRNDALPYDGTWWNLIILMAQPKRRPTPLLQRLAWFHHWKRTERRPRLCSRCPSRCHPWLCLQCTFFRHASPDLANLAGPRFEVIGQLWPANHSHIMSYRNISPKLLSYSISRSHAPHPRPNTPGAFRLK